MTVDEVIEIFKSGDFTIAYHDKEICNLYKGKHDYDNLPEEVDFEFTEYFNGYTPEIVYLLVDALKGKSVSI